MITFFLTFLGDILLGDLGAIFGYSIMFFALSTTQIELAASAARAALCNLLLAWLSDCNVMSLIH